MDLIDFSRIRETGELPLRIPATIQTIEDLNNTFDPYIGSWTTQANGTNITIFISKTTREYVRGSILEVLRIKYRIEDLNGNLILDARSMSSGSSGMEGEYFTNNGYYTGRWGHRDTPGTLCSSSGHFFMKHSIVNLSEKIEFSYIYGRDMGNRSCTNGYETPPIPRDSLLTFTRV
jgi:hypothetical protein